MPKSPAFIRIKAAVLAVIEAVPPGRVTSFRAIGVHLDVMPRHVAYILSQLTDTEKEDIPWHRVVNDQGKLDRVRATASGATQRELLEAEGITFTLDHRLQDFDRLFFVVDETTTGVASVPRQPIEPH